MNILYNLLIMKWKYRVAIVLVILVLPLALLHDGIAIANEALERLIITIQDRAEDLGR